MLGHASHGTNFHAVVVVLECTTHGEEHGADDAVGKHHEEGSSPSERLHRGDPDEDNTHVRHRRIGHHFLQVGLAQTNNSTPHKRNHTEGQQPELEMFCSMREHR